MRLAASLVGIMVIFAQAAAPVAAQTVAEPTEPTCICTDGTVLACPGCESARFCTCPNGSTGVVDPPPMAQPVARPVAQPVARPVAQPVASPATQPTQSTTMRRSPIRLWGGLGMAVVGGLSGLNWLSAYNACSGASSALGAYGGEVSCGGTLTRSLVGFAIAGGGAWLAMNSMVPAPLNNLTFQPRRAGFAVHGNVAW